VNPGVDDHTPETHRYTTSYNINVKIIVITERFVCWQKVDILHTRCNIGVIWTAMTWMVY